MNTIERAGSVPPGHHLQHPDAEALAAAILQTLVYADLFDYPLTIPELAHYLIGCPARAEAITTTLRDDPGLGTQVAQHDEFVFLRGREAVVDIREARREVAVRLWRRASRYSRLLRHFPFVRMLAVTGALAMDNVDARSDIDLLVIAAPGRVWICRRLLTIAVRVIRLLGDEICPNFVLAADSLTLPQEDLFTAHELAQMRPLAGYEVYQTMMARNGWLLRFLPNAGPWPAARAATVRRTSWVQHLLEPGLRVHHLDRWERWELTRLRRKLGPSPDDEEISCTASQCKGHTGHYRRDALSRYVAALVARGVPGGAFGYPPDSPAGR